MFVVLKTENGSELAKKELKGRKRPPQIIKYKHEFYIIDTSRPGFLNSQDSHEYKPAWYLELED